MSSSSRVVDEPTVSLLENATALAGESRYEEEDEINIKQKAWIESKKLWQIAGPAIFSRLSSYAVFVVTQAFAGHLGDLELAAITMGTTVIIGFDFGLMLGMASALETLCGQAFGAKNYHMLGIYLQRSWVVLFICCILLLPLFLFTSPLLKLLGQPSDVAELSGVVSLCLIPLHFSFAFQFPLQRYLQCQLKNAIIAWVSIGALVVHVIFTWLIVSKFELGVIGTALSLNLSWWIIPAGMFAYTVCGGCPLSWTGFSVEAFSDIWEFVKLSTASGVMLCLEHWYYRILIVMTGNLNNAEIAVDALSICMSINGWELMIPLAFFAATGVRVANELGAGNARGAKFATIVAVTTSTIIGIFFWLLIMIFHNEMALIFSSSKVVLEAVNKLSILLAFTILLNSVQPILSGVAVGSGWQSYVAYINLGCYYLIGVPLGIALGWIFHLGVMVERIYSGLRVNTLSILGLTYGEVNFTITGFMTNLGIWAGMIFGGTAIQTLILAVITIRCDWEKEAQRACLHVKKWGDMS